jgi:hypothetical protein
MAEANTYGNFFLFSLILASATTDTIYNTSFKIKIKLEKTLASTEQT